jgi:hypothetical protein
MQPEEEAKSTYLLAPKAKHWPWLGSLITFIICLSLGVAVLLFRQSIIDNINYYNFKPTSSISNIASSAMLTQSGLFYFYSSVPQVDASDEFNLHCVRQEASSAILGCYTNQRIYIYDVKNDTRLEGIKTVSAAHEMLHAAWERLSSSEKDRLSTLLEAAYKIVKTDELKSRMEYYDREQPGDHIQELHSILGTEFNNLGDELNTYYERYFSDRPALVALHDKYSQIITDTMNKQKSLLAQVNSLGADLTKRINTYNNSVKQLNSEAMALEVESSKVDNTNLSQITAFNTKRSSLIKRINALDAEQSSIVADQVEYNDLINEYNSTVIIGNGLTNSLDSTLEAPASV